MGKNMNYNKIIIALVIIFIAVAVTGLLMLNQTGNNKINNATNVTNKTNTTNTTNVTNTTNTTPKISTDEVNVEQESSSKRSYADMAHDSDVHSNPEKAKELNDNIVGGKDGIYYFSDGSSVDMR